MTVVEGVRLSVAVAEGNRSSVGEAVKGGEGVSMLTTIGVGEDNLTWSGWFSEKASMKPPNTRVVEMSTAKAPTTIPFNPHNPLRIGHSDYDSGADDPARIFSRVGSF